MSQIRCPNCNCTAIRKILGNLKCLNCGNQDFSDNTPILSRLANFQTDDYRKNCIIDQKTIHFYDKVLHYIDDVNEYENSDLLSSKNYDNYPLIFRLLGLYHGNLILKNKIEKYIRSEKNKKYQEYAISWLSNEKFDNQEVESFLFDSNDDLRLIGIEKFVNGMNNPENIEKLKIVFETDTNTQHRRLIFNSLKLFDKISHSFALEILSDDHDAYIRMSIFNVLLNKEIDTKITSIIIALNDSNNKIISVALEEASKIKDIRFVDLIKRIYFSNSDPKIKSLAIETLRGFGKKTAREADLMVSVS